MEPAKAMQEKRATVGTILWMLCAQFLVMEQVVRRAWDVPSEVWRYSFLENPISDLGAVACGMRAERFVCSPHHAWMNTSFMVQGALIVLGALLVRRLFSPRRSYSVALGLLALSGLGVLTAGLAPEDVYEHVHIAAAACHFVMGGAGIAMMGILLLRDARRSAIAGWLSVATGTAVLIAAALLATRGDPMWEKLNLGLGSVERVAAYGITLWFAAMGAGLLVRRTP